MFKKTIVEEEPKIEFLTDLDNAIELVPPVPLRQAMPNWYKQSSMRCPVDFTPPGGRAAPGAPPAPPPPSNVPHGMSTIKACAGVVDLMRWGYMVPLWQDHEIMTYPDSMTTGRYVATPATTEVKTSGFAPETHALMPKRDNEYPFSIKLDSPWLIRTPPGYSIALLPLPFGDDEFKNPWRIIPGIIDTDRYHNFNVLFRWNYEGIWLIEQGTPMCAVVPFRRSDTSMKHELTKITSEERQLLRARGKGGTGSGDRKIKMPYQKWRKQQELAEKKKG